MSTESTLMVENLVIKGDKLSKEALLPTYVKNKNKCIETSPLREPDWEQQSRESLAEDYKSSVFWEATQFLTFNFQFLFCFYF